MSQPCLVPRAAWFAAPVVLLLTPVLTLFAAAPPRLDSVTFSKDVAPVLFKHCASCHRPGEIGPFSLLTFKDAAKRANFLKQITSEKRMPPWKPVHGYGDFQDERRLSDTEIKTLARWADSGAKEGDAKDLPAAPKFTQGWQLGTPDLILKMPEPFTIPAGGKDIFRAFVIPTGLKQNRTVAAMEFRPGNRRVIHHSIITFDTTGAARKKDEADPGPGFGTPGPGLGIDVTGQVGGWAPGSTPRRLPDGVGRRLLKDSDMVVQIHYVPSGKEEKDQSTVGIYFTKEPARQILQGVKLSERRISIRAGAKRHRMVARYILPVDVHAIGVLPHMHLLGREMKLIATLPGGKKQPMLWIKDWDFNWQGQYQYARPVPLPKGTVLLLEGFYDNSSNNPKNPNDPPKRVLFGMKTKDEMFGCRVQVIVDHPPGDGILLLKDQARAGQQQMRAYQRWLERD